MACDETGGNRVSDLAASEIPHYAPVQLHRPRQSAQAFTEEFHARIVRTGFDQWFKVAAGAPTPGR
jgi:hypothetical protein